MPEFGLHRLRRGPPTGLHLLPNINPREIPAFFNKQPLPRCCFPRGRGVQRLFESSYLQIRRRRGTRGARPLGNPLLGQPAALIPSGLIFSFRRSLPHSIPTKFYCISDVTANSPLRDDPPELQSKRAMGATSHHGQVCRTKSGVQAGDARERGNL